MTVQMREFQTGATRDLDTSKPDYEGFLSPLVVKAFGAYMNFHRKTANGLRASDNWQKGIPRDVYMKSAWRHFLDAWCEHRGHPTADGMTWALLALLFNVQGYLHEYLKANPDAVELALACAEISRASGSTTPMPSFPAVAETSRGVPLPSEPAPEYVDRFLAPTLTASEALAKSEAAHQAASGT